MDIESSGMDEIIVEDDGQVLQGVLGEDCNNIGVRYTKMRSRNIRERQDLYKILFAEELGEGVLGKSGGESAAGEAGTGGKGGKGKGARTPRVKEVVRPHQPVRRSGRERKEVYYGGGGDDSEEEGGMRVRERKRNILDNSNLPRRTTKGSRKGKYKDVGAISSLMNSGTGKRTFKPVSMKCDSDDEICVLEEKITPTTKQKRWLAKVMRVNNYSQGKHLIAASGLVSSAMNSSSTSNMEEDQLTCPVCLVSFWYPNQTSEHMKSVHKIENPERHIPNYNYSDSQGKHLLKNIAASGQVSNNEDEQLTCSVCLINFWYPNQTSEHMKSVHNIRNQERHMKDHYSQGKHMLKKMAAVSSAMKQLSISNILEEEDEQLTCPVCLTSFWYPNQTSEHLKRVHDID